VTRLWILSNLHLEAVLRRFALADKGHDLRLIQDYLDHRDPRRTAHYTRTAGRRFEGLRSR
jgi:site-specific recombinase XerD